MMTASSNWIAALRLYLAIVAGADLVWEAARAALHLKLDELIRVALSAFEPARSNILGRRSLPFKQLVEYRARWLSGACSEGAV
jgi:hypothetical protein